MQLECYVIGGYVRDFFLYRPSKDIDIVAVGKGIELAEAVVASTPANLRDETHADGQHRASVGRIVPQVGRAPRLRFPQARLRMRELVRMLSA